MTAPTLTSTITAGQRTITLTGDCSAAAVGGLYRIEDELIRLDSFVPLTGHPGNHRSDYDLNRWNVSRGLDGGVAAAHSSTTSVVAARDAFAAGSDLSVPSPFSAGGSGVTVDNTVDPPAAVTSIVAPGATIDGSTATLLLPVIVGPFAVSGDDAALAADWVLLRALEPGVLVERILVFCLEDFVDTGRLKVAVGDPAVSLPAIWNASVSPGPGIGGGNAPDFEAAAASTGGNVALAVSGAVLVGAVDTVGIYATIDSVGSGEAVVYAVIATPPS